MSTADFGAAGAPDGWETKDGFDSDAVANFPWGHGSSGNWEPYKPTETGSDNPRAITPAGRLLCSMDSPSPSP